MVKAPSTLGTFLRSFRWGHVRQLDRVAGALRRAVDHRPGLHHRTYGLAKEGARHHGYTGQRGLLAVAAGTGDVLMARLGAPPTPTGCATPGPSSRCGPQRLLRPRHRRSAACPLLHHHPPHQSLRNLIEAIPETDWTPIPYWMDGAADVAETNYTPFQSEPGAAPVRLIVRRVKPTPGSQLALFATYSYHAFITDRDGDTLELEADHRRHAEIENAIRDLKYGVGLNHAVSQPTAPGAQLDRHSDAEAVAGRIGAPYSPRRCLGGPVQ